MSEHSEETETISTEVELGVNSSVNTFAQFIKSFSGDRERDQSIQSFFESVEDIAGAYRWPTRIIKWIIRSKLTGGALHFFDSNLRIKRSNDLLEIKEILIQRFSNREDSEDIWLKFILCKQKVEENVIDYSLRLETLRDSINRDEGGANATHIGVDRMLLIFLEGINEKIKEHMITYDPSTFDHAVSMASKIENKLRKQSHSKSTSMVTSMGESTHNLEFPEDSIPINEIKTRVQRMSLSGGFGASDQESSTQDWAGPTEVGPAYISQSSYQSQNSNRLDSNVGRDHSVDGSLIWDTDHGVKGDRVKHSHFGQGIRLNSKTKQNSNTGSKLLNSTGMTVNDMHRVYGGTKHTLKAKIAYSILQGLVDSASDFSLISFETLERLKLNKHIYRSSKLDIEGAAHGIISTDSSTDLRLQLQHSSNTYFHTFKVVPRQAILDYEFIIGMDFLLVNKATVDIHKGKLLFEGRVVSDLILSKNNRYTSAFLRFTESDQGYRQGRYDGKNTLFKDQNKYMRENNIDNHSYTLDSPSAPLFLNQIINKTPAKDNSSISPSTINRNTTLLTKLLEIAKSSETDDSTQRSISNILYHRENAFALDSSEIGEISGYSHDIVLSDYSPINGMQYQIPLSLRNELKVKLDSYLKAGIIEKSYSAWNNPLIVKRKKGGGVRIVLDATAVNHHTKKIDYPMVRTEDVLHQLSGYKWFSTIDLESGYHQIVLDQHSRPFFAFRTPWGKFQYRRMPMGASNSGLYFQMVMEEVLGSIRCPNLIIFQDDILIATKDIDTHLELLTRVLDIFVLRGLRINVSKCRLLRRNVNFLGHLLREGNFSPDEGNLISIREFKEPNTKRRLRSFLGKINYYARFIPSLSHTAAPLTDMLAGIETSLQWNDIEKQAFLSIKDQLCQSPILHYPDFDKTFYLSIRVSSRAMAGVLEQDDEGGRWPLGYFSKKFKPVEQNYSDLERNALAIVTTVEHFNPIIYGYPVVIFSCKKAVEYLRSLRGGGSRISDWIIKTMRHSPEFIFSKTDDSISHLLMDEDELPISSVSECNSDHPIISPIPTVFTDGSCFKNGSESAYSGLGIHWESPSLPDRYEPIFHKHSNNRAELKAVISAIKEGVKHGMKQIIIKTDSRYVIDNVNNNLNRWSEEGWLNNRKKTIANLEEFQEIHHLLGYIDVNWIHVKGHSGISGNDTAHLLASQGASLINQNTNLNSTSILKKQDANTSKNIPSHVHFEINENTNKAHVMASRTTQHNSSKITLKLMKDEQESDIILAEARKDIVEGNNPKDWGRGIHLYLGVDGLIYAKGIVFLNRRNKIYVNSIYVPTSLRGLILREIHESKWIIHGNVMNMTRALLPKYFWSSFRSDIHRYISSCEICQKMSPVRKKPIVMEFIRPSRPGEMIAMDLIGPLYTSNIGHRYILSIIDMFSRYIVLTSVRDQEAATLAGALERNYITVFGTPRIILSDCGSNFRSKLFKDVCSILHIKHSFSPPYHPATNGMVERSNRETKKRLTILCERAGDTWSNKLHLVQFAHNEAYHSGIDCSPNLLTFGRSMEFPHWNRDNIDSVPNTEYPSYVSQLQDRLKLVRDMASSFDDRISKERNQRINVRKKIPEFQIGDHVLYKKVRQGKTKREGFKFIYEGPYLVSKKISDVSFEIREEKPLEHSRIMKAHAERLKKYIDPIKNNMENTVSYTHNNPVNIDPQSTRDPSTQNREIEVRSLNRDYDDTQTPDTVLSNEYNQGNNPSDQTTHNYHTRSKGKIDSSVFTRYEIKRGRVVDRT